MPRVQERAATTPEELFTTGTALAVYRAVRALADRTGLPYEVRTSASQVALRRRRGFAFLWPPGRYLARPGAEVVLSIALDHDLGSERFKEVVHPAPSVWMHHLEVHGLQDLDDEVAGWLRAAALAAG